MKLATSNIKSRPRMPYGDVLSDINHVGAFANAIGWQEISLLDYKEALKLTLNFRWRHFFLDHETPISLSNVWRVMDRGQAVKMHDSLGRISPARYYNYMLIKHRNNSHQHPVAFMNTHYISGAFSPKTLSKKSQRLDLWNKAFETQQAGIMDLHRQGITVIGTGDFNRHDMPKFANGQRWLAAGGYDRVWCLEAPGGAKIELESTDELRGLHTDHNPQMARIIIR